jgi:hypothetical protein
MSTPETQLRELALKFALQFFPVLHHERRHREIEREECAKDLLRFLADANKLMGTEELVTATYRGIAMQYQVRAAERVESYFSALTQPHKETKK